MFLCKSNIFKRHFTRQKGCFQFRIRAIICKYVGSTHILFTVSGNDSSRKIQLYPNLWAWTKMKLWWRRCCFWWRYTFGLDLPFPKIYNINSVICFLLFLRKSGFIAFNYRKSFILHGYDVTKCEWLCIGESAFNLARDIGGRVMGEWPVWRSLGTNHCYTWAYVKPCNL